MLFRRPPIGKGYQEKPLSVLSRQKAEDTYVTFHLLLIAAFGLAVVALPYILR